MSRASSWPMVCAGLSLLVGLGARAEAGELFRKCFGDCGSSCGSQVIQLPSQQVVVETSRPRVVVEETRVEKPLRVSRVAATPVVGSFFMPMPLHLGVVGAPLAHSLVEDSSASRTLNLDSASLRMAHELELNRLHLDKLQAAHELDLRHVRNVMERVSAPRETALTPLKTTGTDSCCEDVKAQLKNLVTRVEKLEQLVSYHDKAIRAGVQVPKEGGIQIPKPQE